jgi:hypothetical protein
VKQWDDNLPKENSDAENTEAGKIAPDATPLCLNCLKPVDPKQYYCPHCGSNEAINPLATYMPLVRIRHNYDIFITLWRKLWRRRTGSTAVIFFTFLITMFAPAMLLGLPVMLWFIIRDKHLRAYRLSVFALVLAVAITIFLIFGGLSLLSGMSGSLTAYPVRPK